MKRLSDPALQGGDALAWPERNQRWLSQRLAFWRECIERHSRDGALPCDMPPAEALDFEPAASRLAALFGLSDFETELVVLAAGIELDAGLRNAVAQAHCTPAGHCVRLGYSLALALLPQAHWDALSPSGALRHWSLIDVDSSGGFSQAMLRIDERVLHFLTGVAAFDERLRGVAQLAGIDASPHAQARQVAQALAGLTRPLVLLPDALQDAAHRTAARALAGAVFAHAGLQTLWVDAAALPPAVGIDARELADIARRIDREAALAHAGVATVLESDAQAGNLVRFIAALRSPVVVLGSLSPLQLADMSDRQPRGFKVSVLPAAGRKEWPPAVQRACERAMQQFRVEPGLLDQALSSISGVTDESAIASALWDTLRESARGGLDALAQRIVSQASFDDLVVPPMVLAQLQEIANQLRQRQRVYADWGFGDKHSRGLGIAALFAGESGTGKTLAAEVIANEARLDLYRIDLASVVSKYIGETEKNLSRLFDAAERSGAVLLFDEADALFGKRSEVKDSHDRYANIEVAYLLQRIESYRGLAILTSNLKSSLDRAFLRRIRFVVQFPFPDEAAREQVWRRQFPPRAPLGAVDFAALAKLQLSGGHIRSVALNAAFHAAGQGVPIAQASLVAAARAEFAKLERSFNALAGGGI
jgi:hypothetical protein